MIQKNLSPRVEGLELESNISIPPNAEVMKLAATPHSTIRLHVVIFAQRAGQR